MQTILNVQRTYLNLAALTVGAVLAVNNFGCSPACGGDCSEENDDTDTGSPNGSGGKITAGSGGADPSGGRNGSGSSEGSGSAGSDTPSGGAGSDGSSGGAAGEGKPLIEFQIATVRADPTNRDTSFSVRSYETSSTSTCTTTTKGACYVKACANESDTDLETVYANVGHAEATIDQDGQISTSVVDYDGSEQSVFARFDPRLTILGEETIQIEVSGGDLGTFSRTLMQPLYLITTNPLLPNEGELNSDYVALSRSQGLMLTWERGTSGTSYYVQTVRYASSDEAMRYSLNCQFPAEDGQGFIDPSLLASLPADDELMTFGVVDDLSDWGDYQARVRLLVNTINPTKNRAVSLRLVD